MPGSTTPPTASTAIGAVEDLPYIAPRARRFDTDYTDPGRVIADLAAAYPHKFMWGSDSPFYSYAAEINGQVVRLISTYETRGRRTEGQSVRRGGPHRQHQHPRLPEAP